MKLEVLHNASLSDLSSIVLFLNKLKKTEIKAQLIFELIRNLSIPFCLRRLPWSRTQKANNVLASSPWAFFWIRIYWNWTYCHASPHWNRSHSSFGWSSSKWRESRRRAVVYCLFPGAFRLEVLTTLVLGLAVCSRRLCGIWQSDGSLWGSEGIWRFWAGLFGMKKRTCCQRPWLRSSDVWKPCLCSEKKVKWKRVS